MASVVSLHVTRLPGGSAHSPVVAFAAVVALVALDVAPVAAQQAVGSPTADSGGLFGPFSGIVAVAFLAWRVTWLVGRVRQQREEREARAWRDGSAGGRPDWMAASPLTRTSRLLRTSDALDTGERPSRLPKRA